MRTIKGLYIYIQYIFLYRKLYISNDSFSSVLSVSPFRSGINKCCLPLSFLNKLYRMIIIPGGNGGWESSAFDIRALCYIAFRVLHSPVSRPFTLSWGGVQVRRRVPAVRDDCYMWQPARVAVLAGPALLCLVHVMKGSKTFKRKKRFDGCV